MVIIIIKGSYFKEERWVLVYVDSFGDLEGIFRGRYGVNFWGSF